MNTENTQLYNNKSRGTKPGQNPFSLEFSDEPEQITHNPTKIGSQAISFIQPPMFSKVDGSTDVVTDNHTLPGETERTKTEKRHRRAQRERLRKREEWSKMNEPTFPS